MVLLNLITGVIIAITAALVSVWLALRRFRAERIWERKLDAYVRIVEALHDAKAFAEHHLEALIGGREIAEDQDTKLRGRARAGNDEVLKAIDTGALLLPAEAIARLRKYSADSDKASKSEAWFDYLEADLAAAQKCLDEITQIARRDLNVTRL